MDCGGHYTQSSDSFNGSQNRLLPSHPHKQPPWQMPNEIAVGEDFVFIGGPYAGQAITVFDRISGNFVANTTNRGGADREIPCLESTLQIRK